MQVGGMCGASGVDASWFLNSMCSSLYTVLRGMWDAGETPLYPRIIEGMRRLNAWHDSSPSFYHDIKTFCPVATAAPNFIQTLREKAVLRGLVQACVEIQAKAGEPAEASDLVASALKQISDVASLGSTKEAKTLAQHAAAYYRTLIENDGKDNSIKTGLSKLDLMSPLNRGDMPAISGERKSGKSILSISIALNIAQKYPVLYFSLEDKITKLIKRIVSNVSKVPTPCHRNPSGGQEMQMGAAMTRMQAMNLMLHDDAYDIGAIVARTRQTKTQNPELAVVFVDYLQLIRGGREKGDSREMQVAAISRTLRLLAMETDTAIIVLVQLNKDGDTRESKAIEMDITAMWKLSLVNDEMNERLFEIPFQRDGDSGVGFKVAFLGERASVETLYEDATTTR